MSARPQPRAKVKAIPQYSRAAAGRAVTWNVSSNESTVPPSPAILEAITRAGAQAHLYPTLTGEELTDAVSARVGVSPEQVVVGGGSLSLLQLALTAFTGSGTEVVHAWRSYEAYPILISIADADRVPVPLDAAHRHDVDAMLAAITPRTAAVMICNPNNPTGTALPDDEVLRMIEAVPRDVVVLLDEAYREFGESRLDVADLVGRYENLIVFRTFSKAYGLAGLRAGYALGSGSIMTSMRAVAPPFLLSAVAEAAALAALDDPEHTTHIVASVCQSREAFEKELRERGLDVPPSQANFVFLPVADRALELEQACAARGVAVRAFAGDGVRVTMGYPGAEAAVLEAVDAVFSISEDAGRSPA
ncbi:histidinol-phosphate transaminase [Kineosporia succinea]|uniref:Histidinol-phosphate aminotransferase n=1 Tax=Kineosporia succinea TaxID=84632 RepID=A0ABT9PDB2_9ACTN|nr:histidinol-phosphate transaminase [Kineosporia succinea]MDP9830682.1 histidinol-phosphate aminotransferase [Kineosporia succinea]